MKVKFCCNSGANIHSCREEVVDLEIEYKISDDEWDKMEDDEKWELVKDWADNRLEIYWEAVE